MARLNTYVDVDGTWYGPGGDLPDAVAARITNPKVWADGHAPTQPSASVAEPGPVTVTPAPADPAPAGAGLEEVKEPPRGGPGSSADAWRAFLQSQNVDVPEDASARDMHMLWDERK